MAKNTRFNGAGAKLTTRSLPVPADTASGDPVKVGSLVGVAQTDRATADNWGGGNPVGFATVAIDGAHDLTVTGALAGAGTPVYITTGGTLTATVSTNTLFGHSIPGVTADGSKGTGDGLVTVELVKV